MRYPKKLRRGDTIGLVCPSSGISPERQQQCCDALIQMGYRVKLAGNLTARVGGYMAGDGATRGHWINQMFADPDVGAIFCARGGDGGSRIMEYIDWDILRQHPKIFVGYSDVTSLHSGIANHCDFVTFHGPMVSSNMVNEFDVLTRDNLLDTINADTAFTFQNPIGMPILALKEGLAMGSLTGGNLAVLSASIGTDYEIDTKGKILFLEEVNETMPRIDRFSYHLINAGKFRDCVGVLLGQFTNCANAHAPEYTECAYFREILAEYDIPVLYNIQCGHSTPTMTLPLGATCTIDSAQCSIRFDAPIR